MRPSQSQRGLGKGEGGREGLVVASQNFSCMMTTQQDIFMVVTKQCDRVSVQVILKILCVFNCL